MAKEKLLTTKLQLAPLLGIAVFFSGFNGLRVYENVTFGDVLLLIVGAMWVLSWPLSRLSKPSWSTVASFMLFVLAYIFEGLFSGGIVGENNSIELMKFLTSFYLLNYLISDLSKSDQAIKNLMVAYCASGIVNAVVGIADVSNLTDIGTWLHVRTVNDYSFGTRAHGLTMHPNHMAQHSAMALFLIIGFLKKKDSSVKRILKVAVALVLLLGVLASGSRGALFSVLVVGTLLCFIYLRKLYRYRSATLISVAAIMCSFAVAVTLNLTHPLLGAWDRLLQESDGLQESNEARAGAYDHAWQDFTDHMLAGSGYSSIGAAHNIYLQILQSAGLLGMAGLLLYFVAPIWNVRSLLKYKNLDNLILAVVCSVGIFLISGLVENMIYVRSALIPMGFLWALIRLHRRQRLNAEAIGAIKYNGLIVRGSLRSEN